MSVLKRFHVQLRIFLAALVMAAASMHGDAEAQTSVGGPAVSPGALYGVNAAGELLTIDPADLAERKVGPIGVAKVNALAYDSRSETLYGLTADGNVLVIDRQTGGGRIVQKIPVPGSPLFTALAFEVAGSGGRLYAANAIEGRELFRIDLGTTPPHPVVRLGSTQEAQITGLAVQPGTGRLYGIHRNRNALGILASATGAFEKVFPNCGINNPEGLAFDPDTGVLYGVFSPGTLGAYDLATGLANAVGRTTSTTALAYAPRPSAEEPALVTRAPAGFVPLPAPVPGSRHPKLASVLVEVIDAYAANPQRGLALAASRGLLVERDNEVLVEIQADPRAAQRVRAFLEANGMRLRHQLAQGFYEAWLPIPKIRSLVENADVQFIRQARLSEPLAGASTTQGVGVTGAAVWHAGLFTGTGVILANIDSGFAGYQARQASGDWPNGGQATLIDTNGGGFGNTAGSHGVATVEINYDMAPGAQYRIYDTTTVGDWIAALNDAAANGADVVSVSLGAPLDGIGDGTALPGSVAAAAQSARLQGVLVVNAAGNSRESHWGGLYSDSTAVPSSHDWGGTNVNHGLFCQPVDKQLQVELFWDDWTGVNQDYNLYLLELGSSGWVQRASSQNFQTGAAGQKPQEALAYKVSSPLGGGGCPPGNGAFGVLVTRISAASNRNLQLFTNLGRLYRSVPARSLGFPADSPAVMTVAAVDVKGTFPQEPYSSEGPVLGPGGSLAPGALAKPDIAAYANVDTQAAGAGVFAGTSAATPHVAGAAALVLQAYPGYKDRPDALERHLEECALDLGPPGQDTLHGAGRLVLCSDVRTRDNATDAGAEPHTAGDIWNSPDIRLCTALNCSADQDPDFGNPAYLYVTLTNGPPAQATSGTLFVYYTAFGGAAQWSPAGTGNVFGDWTLINTGGTSVSLPAGQVSTVVQIPWNTVPAPGHYCLLTRWVSSQDPVAFPEGPQTTTNVRNNNNISWKNFNVVNVLKKMSETSEYVVRNVDSRRRNVDLGFSSEGQVVADGGSVTVRLGELFARWQKAGAKGRNVTVQEPGLVRLTGTPAAILGIPMGAGEAAALEITAGAREPVPHPGTSRRYEIAVTQSVGGEVLGGATYTLITRARNTDTDGDGIPDVRDPDDDGDGVRDTRDADPVDRTVGQKGPVECTIDLARNRHTCGGIPGLQFINAPAQSRALVKLTLDPATSGFERAVFTVEYGEAPKGWSVNIGDSRSNDGHGGDAGDQTYSAELQILEDDLSIFGNDLLLPNPLHLALVENVAGAGKAVQVEVADGFVGWKSPGRNDRLASPHLFGLAGQRDTEGPTNRDIYAAFNRTISGRNRTGTGVRRVRIQLIPPRPKAPLAAAGEAPAASPGS